MLVFNRLDCHSDCFEFFSRIVFYVHALKEPCLIDHLLAIFRLRRELRENRARADSLRTPELVEEARVVLTKTVSFCPQGCPLLEDYQRLKKEISFYLK